MTTANTNEDKLILGGHEFTSRFILGSGKFSLELVKACIEKAGTQIVTLALRRANEGGLANILDYVPKDVTLLPNTSGARNAEEAVRIARLSRELGCGDFVKIEVIHDSKYLLPDNYETIKATEILAKEGFVVMPYMYPDLNAARDLVNAGAACVMPLGSPIGSNKGICAMAFLTQTKLPVEHAFFDGGQFAQIGKGTRRIMTPFLYFAIKSLYWSKGGTLKKILWCDDDSIKSYFIDAGKNLTYTNLRRQILDSLEDKNLSSTFRRTAKASLFRVWQHRRSFQIPSSSDGSLPLRPLSRL